MELPDYIDAGLWEEWVAYRREDKKKPASERSQRMTLKKIERLVAEGYDANRLIETAIEREWQGIFPVEECKHAEGGRHSEAHKRTAIERFREANHSTAHLRIVGASR